VAELALHFWSAMRAGGADKALLYSERAAEQAQAVLAYEETARFYEMALQALEASRAPSSVVRCDLLLSLCEALGPAGEPQRLAEEVAEESFTLAETLGDRTRAMRSAYLAIVQGLRRYGGGTVGGSPLMRRWVERLDRYAVPATRERVEADFWSGIFRLAGEGRWVEGWRLIDSARTMARQLQDVESFAFPAALANWYPPRRWEERLAVGLEVAAITPERVSARALAELLNLRNWTCLTLGDRDGAEQAWVELGELAARYREASLVLEPLSHAGYQAMLSGELEQAVTYGERIIARADELGSPVAGRQIAYQLTFRPLLYLDRPEEAQASAFAARRRGGWEDRPAFFRVGERALCLAHAGRADEARAQLALDLASLEISSDTPVRILAALLETALLLRDRVTAAHLVPLLERVVAFAGPLMSVALIVGEAKTMLGDVEGARTHYEQALDWATRLGYRPEIARTRLALGELLLLNGRRATGSRGVRTRDRADGLAHLAFAIDEFQAMKMRASLEHALDLKALATNSAVRQRK
jgi:tetratricopeptide (TPR) repeat protein